LDSKQEIVACDLQQQLAEINYNSSSFTVFKAKSSASLHGQGEGNVPGVMQITGR